MRFEPSPDDTVVTASAVITEIRRAPLSWGGDPPYFARVDITPPAGPPFSTEIRLIPGPSGPLLERFGAPAQTGMAIRVEFDPANPMIAWVEPTVPGRPGGSPKWR